MYKNIKNLVIFQIMFSLIVYSILTPFLKWLFKLSILSCGINNLTQEYFFIYLRNPLAMIIALGILFIMAIITLFYFNALIVFYTASKQNRKIGLYSFIVTTYKTSTGIIKIRNIKLFLFIAFVVPYVGLVFKNPIIKDISVPHFVIDSFSENHFLLIPFLSLSLYLLVYAWNGLFLFYYMYTNKFKYNEAMSCSKYLVSNNKKAILIAFLKIIILAVIITVFRIGIQYAFYGICTIFSKGIMFKIFTTVFSLIRLLMIVIFQIVTGVYAIYQLGEIFYTYEELPEIKYEEDRFHKIPLYLKIILVVVSSLILSTSGVFFVYQEAIPNISIIAHRGASEEELENTQEAFLRAQDEGANIMELDVRLTKDKQLVIFHDESLSRLGGINREINKLTYDEIKNINIHNKALSKTGHIMLLKDLLPLISPDVKLLIEIKQSDNDGIEVADLLEPIIRYYPRFMVGCLEGEVLAEIKKNNPFRTTVYFLAMTFGNWDKSDYVDVYNIEQGFVNKATVDKIHKRDKKIYVWTVNTEDQFYKFQNLRVDGMLTNYSAEMVSLNNSSQLDFNKNHLMSFFQITN
ncbi:MAG: glycerophosphoryl diester phosphodiesterase membrane domain-containing protein [Spirochaetaceae bacterium]|nr:glycerophosphoryl diester phosphodiesterase membrane domain-containing protein [Spirochaetaceae bacterium]